MSCLLPLGEDVENVKLHLRLKGIYTGLKGLNALLSAIFSVECLIPQTYCISA